MQIWNIHLALTFCASENQNPYWRRLVWHTVKPEQKKVRTMNTEERLVDLEIRLARQDDLVETLNTQVYRQQKKIDELSALCTALAGRLRELSVNVNQRQAVIDEKPPHY